MKLKLHYIFLILVSSLILLPNVCFADFEDSFEVDSEAAILINSYNGEILYEKNAYKRMYPASTTKIMTAILVLESRNFS